jgi:cell division protein ZapD
MTDVTYEQPLNERIRALMRLEYLFKQADHSLAGSSIWDNRNTITTLLDILQATNRPDLKTEFIKEFDRLSSNLAPLMKNPDIDQGMLRQILDEIQQLSQRWHALHGLIAQDLRDNEFINSIRQRCSVPGGTSDFDLPALHCWLQEPDEDRRGILRHWLGELDLLRETVDLTMKLTRESARTKRLTAQAGFYQQPLDANAPFQMIRVTLPAASGCYAEISGGKHRITIRFMEIAIAERPAQTEQDIEFTLKNCAI